MRQLGKTHAIHRNPARAVRPRPVAHSALARGQGTQAALGAGMRPTHLVCLFALLLLLAIVRIYQILTAEVIRSEQAMPGTFGVPPSGGKYRGDGELIIRRARPL